METVSFGMKLVDLFSRPLREKLTSANRQLDGLEAKSKSAFGGMGTAAKKSGVEIKKLKGTRGGGGIMGLTGALGPLGAAFAGAFAISSITSRAREVAQLRAEFQGLENAISFATGGQSEGMRAMKFLREESRRLGLDLMSAARGYKGLAASGRQAGLTNKENEDIFRGVSTAVSTMNLSAEDSQGVFLALSQIISKGKVQAEELRGQIGERLPGAFGLAAEAMGVTTQELNKMLERGELYSKDFIPKFAAQLEKEFAGGLEKSTKSLRAQMNRTNNELLETKNLIGRQLTPVFKGFYRAVEDAGKSYRRFFRSHNEESDQLDKLNQRFNARIEAIKMGNLKTGERARLISVLNTEYGSYLPNLLSEHSTLEDIVAAQNQVNKSMRARGAMMSLSENMGLSDEKLGEINHEITKQKDNLIDLRHTHKKVAEETKKETVNMNKAMAQAGAMQFSGFGFGNMLGLNKTAVAYTDITNAELEEKKLYKKREKIITNRQEQIEKTKRTLKAAGFSEEEIRKQFQDFGIAYDSPLVGPKPNDLSQGLINDFGLNGTVKKKTENMTDIDARTSNSNTSSTSNSTTIQGPTTNTKSLAINIEKFGEINLTNNLTQNPEELRDFIHQTIMEGIRNFERSYELSE